MCEITRVRVDEYNREVVIRVVIGKWSAHLTDPGSFHSRSLFALVYERKRMQAGKMSPQRNALPHGVQIHGAFPSHPPSSPPLPLALGLAGTVARIERPVPAPSGRQRVYHVRQDRPRCPPGAAISLRCVTGLRPPLALFAPTAAPANDVLDKSACVLTACRLRVARRQGRR